MGYELKNVTVTYNDVAISQVNCSIADGKWVAVIGQTGAGKSTFVQVLKGLLPFDGEYLIHGEPVRDAKGRVRVVEEVGYVFQYPEHQLFETTVQKELAFGLKLQKKSDAQMKHLFERLLPTLQITEDMLELAPFQLSGGGKRRVALASILCMQPKLLIVDEPTAGLDPQSHQALLKLLKTWQEETGSTIVFVTHQMDDVAEYADEVIVFQQGKLKVHMETTSLFLEHGHIIEESGLLLPDAVTLLRLVEQKVGKKLEVATCKEQAIFDAVLPFLRGDCDA